MNRATVLTLVLVGLLGFAMTKWECSAKTLVNTDWHWQAHLVWISIDLEIQAFTKWLPTVFTFNT